MLCNYSLKTLLLLIILCSPINAVQAELVVTLRAPETLADQRKNYPIAAIKLALDKTQVKYGGYSLNYIAEMNTQRLLAAARANIFPNLIVQAGYDDAIFAKNGLTFVDVPFDLGISSYRICFIHSSLQMELKDIKGIEPLKRFSILQGVGWPDTKILRRNGFNVIESNSYDGLFKMIPARRGDLFCRGINELKKEYDNFKHLEGLAYDSSFALFYPLPRFFYLNEVNQELKNRLREGFELAYKDGSLKRLLFEFYAEDVRFAKMSARQLFQLENPLIKGLDKKYQAYFLTPQDLQ